MARRIAQRMAGAMTERMAKPMRLLWQNHAPNPNPNPTTVLAVVCCSVVNPKSNLSVSYAHFGIGK